MDLEIHIIYADAIRKRIFFRIQNEDKLMIIATCIYMELANYAIIPHIQETASTVLLVPICIVRVAFWLETSS